MWRRQEPRLDPRHLAQRRNPETVDELRFERLRTAQLADAGQDAIELAEDQDGPPHAVSSPSRGRFESAEHLVEAGPKVRENMIAVHAHGMTGMEGCGRPADEHGVGYELLEMSLGGEKPLPVRQVVGNVRHRDGVCHGPRCDDHRTTEARV